MIEPVVCAAAEVRVLPNLSEPQPCQRPVRATAGLHRNLAEHLASGTAPERADQHTAARPSGRLRQASSWTRTQKPPVSSHGLLSLTIMSYTPYPP